MTARLKGWYTRARYLLYLLSRVSWYRMIRAIDRNSSTVVWICQDSSLSTLRAYVTGNRFLNDLALLDALVRRGERFGLKVGPALGEMSSKRLFYTISRQFEASEATNHSARLLNTIGALERSANLVLPTRSEASLWENKGHMHREFARLGVRCPETWIVDGTAALSSIEREPFPLLLKEVHKAGSAGVHRMDDYPMLRREIASRMEQGQTEFVVQRLLDMRRDLRVILVDGRIVLHYWRINHGKEWRPTSTSHGSSVDFASFPELWRTWMIDSFNRLGITTGAFDVAWEQDDIETEPYILEVSPAYMPNPPQPDAYRHLTYAEYKRLQFPRPRYLFDFVDLVFAIKRDVVEAYVRRFPWK